MAKEQNFAHPPRGHVAILAYDDVNNRWQVVECSADGYLKIRWMDQASTVLVQQVMPSLLQPGINTYIGTAWQKQPMIWGVTDRWFENLDFTATDTYILRKTTAVPAGYVYVVEAVSMLLSNRQTTSVSIEMLPAGAVGCAIQATPTLAANTWLFWAGRATLVEDDQIQCYLNACQVGDTFVGRVWGYKMKVDM